MDQKRCAVASKESLIRIFTVPEAPDSTLSRIESEISSNLAGFLNENIAAIEKPLHEIEKDFQSANIPEEPTFVSDYAQDIMEQLVAHSVHTAAPSFIGHMTSALPHFVLPLSKLMVGLNQNLVKIETSKAFTPLERQVLGMMHHLAYGEEDAFYNKWMHSAKTSLGAFCSGGTVANITALWIARNRLLKADGDYKGIAAQGLIAGMLHYGYKGLAVLVSERGHYSLGKTVDLLGIGRDNIVAIKTGENNKVDVQAMREKAHELEASGIKVMALVGVAGTTETGSIDPLNEMADLSEELGCHFHVDAAWGGATLLSKNYRHLLSGIERADSITIDAHKQMYVPMGAGLVLFKDPAATDAIEHHAEYILRKGSKDLGSHTLEGSRPGMAMLVHACLRVIGRKGYEMLIDRSIVKARTFADMIKQDEDFELISEPELCLLTYRYVPKEIQAKLKDADEETKLDIYASLNRFTASMQKRQREAGRSFVSRTRLTPAKYDHQPTVVFRVVLANPLTSKTILKDILAEQKALAKTDPVFKKYLSKYMD
ncbi:MULTISPECIES: pyridoxal-dependent aspartate 1-decarboxylase PanP [unclassified Pseudoalteromonas]|uniref:pyridoxal-dependent aspartate 1-decarboxylase PanP n=1 Tax=unclassified Pseudoalteromonas TaxID=194690 RepID=UPI0010235582|nr:putative pyridoxal-dependent aspartate 1-decarboxylase [Pseudoalteromonas sp. L1]RZF94694.1 putative pyridoxal-dependent aspartate 1-decarboxylase [Pseudoalteromonas sp. CO302Y]RZG11321.1 putative pyridoxal-dependent aspartate 1-decarboxylase [Pseudoalteromonas sp. CO133X]UJX24972.1 putative pyridoxal-dependent aspartate 1-decarboxylase [Pseudoalteromonas sp. CF6-2]WOC25648.1 putative pyridoxal-dependent aspartate 1-decarboxylase [Pseudoalteromonas sp. N1230-9]